MALYQVIVSNIGIVYAGGDKTKAEEEYEDYVLLSELGVGHAGGENVTLMVEEGTTIKETTILKEHIGDGEKITLEEYEKGYV